MSKNFLADMEIGDLGEQLWAAWVEAKGGECTISTGKCDWDVHDTNKDVYYEVKTDIQAYKWAKKYDQPINFFLEYETTKSQKPCGIMKTSAKYLVYIIRNPQRLHVAYTFDLDVLRPYLWDKHKYKTFPVKTPFINGTGNVNGWTPPVHELVNDEKSGFMKLIVLPMFLLNKSNETTLSQLSLLEAGSRCLTEV